MHSRKKKNLPQRFMICNYFLPIVLHYRTSFENCGLGLLALNTVSRLRCFYSTILNSYHITRVKSIIKLLPAYITSAELRVHIDRNRKIWREQTSRIGARPSLNSTINYRRDIISPSIKQRAIDLIKSSPTIHIRSRVICPRIFCFRQVFRPRGENDCINNLEACRRQKTKNPLTYVSRTNFPQI